ncbi:flagellin lysine-N-methylase [Brevibacillus migulae]|uniref:flagellin lysine-N-methylase n=1 Tax=Brevibacillus migulae TaxID=1644114 RepID=UPI00106E194C|nr:flagellin lysine-N-methylase [Brevibacillus migulae]
MKTTGMSADYLQSFECTGSACEDTCCSGWGVSIDKRTFDKYKSLQDKTWKRKLTSHIYRNKYETTFSSYAMIKMEKGSYCPFLNKDRLCSIQLSLGSSYLSKTCAGYPRQLNKVFESYDSSAVLSCPEVARLTLLRPEGLTFSPAVNEIEPNPLIDKLVEDEGFRGTFEQMRTFIISLLQNRSMPLHARLLLLGHFILDLERAIEEDGDGPILETIAHWQSVIDHEEWQELVDALPVDAHEQFRMLLSIVEDYLAHTEVTSQRYMECYQEWAEGIRYDVDNYQQAEQTYYASFLEEHAYLLENYAVHYVFTQLFPFSVLGESLYADYVLLILHVALIRFHLIGLAAYHKGLSPEQVVTLVYTFARTYEHDSNFFKNILHYLREKQWDTLPNMSILLR